MADKIHLLIAEDECHTALSLKILLKRAGYCTTFVGDGLSALELLSRPAGEREDIDVLLTDIQMPRMNGIELIKAMKAKGIKTPVLVLTGFGDKETLIELLREGCEDYIDKPFTEKELLERLAHVLEKEMGRRKERSVAEEFLGETRRKLESYRSAFSQSCESLDSAINAYKGIMQAPVSSQKVEVAVKTLSKDRLGGDYCSVCDFPWGCDMIVADVAGHDIGASFHTVLIKSFFDINCSLGHSGDEFMASLNRELFNAGANERMVSALFVRINLDSMWIETVAAGHPYMVNIKAGPSIEVSSRCSFPSGLPLGVLRTPVLDIRRESISSGERLFIYTDGIPDARSLDVQSGARTKFGKTLLLESFRRTSSLPLAAAVDGVWGDVMEFCKGKISDDMLLLGIEIPASAGKGEA